MFMWLRLRVPEGVHDGQVAVDGDGTQVVDGRHRTEDAVADVQLEV